MAKILVSLDNHVLSWKEWGMANVLQMSFRVSCDTKVVNDPITLPQSIQSVLFRRILAAASIRIVYGNHGGGTPLRLILATVKCLAMVLNGMGVGGALALKGVGSIPLQANGLEQHSGFQSFFILYP